MDNREYSGWGRFRLFAQDANSTTLLSAGSPDAEHARTNFVLLAAVFTISMLQLLMAPLILPVNVWTVFAIVALCAVSTPLHWGLMHESIHGNLFPDSSANRRAGRLLGALLFLSWDVMRFGHLLHHSSNRHEFDRPEAVPPGGSRISAAGPYFLKLFGGHALTSAVSAIVLATPARAVARLIGRLGSDNEVAAIRTTAIRALTSRERQARIRIDLLGNFALLALACYCWRGHWPVLAASIGVRFLVLSLLDNAPHYGTAIDSGTRARNTSLPLWASWFVIEHNFHGIHHQAPNLRWHELRQAFENSGSGYDGTWAAAVLRQFRGPLVLDGHNGR